MRSFALLLAAVTACSPASTGESSDMELENLADQANAVAAEAANLSIEAETLAAVEPRSGWTYSSKSDPMSDEKTELACVQSSNSIYLSQPYGETGARLCLRNSPQFGRDAYLSLNENGQILCRSYESCKIRVRFDKAPAESWSAIGPSDHSTDTVFIQNRSAFERKLRVSDTTHVQLEFYQDGMQTFTFNTAGLKWGGSK